MPGLRRQGRTLALQLLYQTEIAGGHRAGNIEAGNIEAEDIERFWSGADASRKARAFAMQLYDVTQANGSAINDMISANLEHWRLSRLSVIVRNLLRMAVAEMIYVRDVAHPVVIDEAIDLARTFEDDEAARFVNGVLDRIWRVAGEAGSPAVEFPPAPG